MVIGRGLDNGGVGTGTFNLTGGTVNAATSYGVTTIASAVGETGVLSVSGGTFNSTQGGLYVGEGYFSGSGIASGTLTVSGTGVVNLGAEATGLELGVHTSANGTVNLNGGTIETAGVGIGAGTGTFNFNGGTLEATTSNSTFITGLTNVYVLAGGGTIDNGGNAITIAQALLSGVSNDGGLISQGAGTLTLIGNNAYNGGTTIDAGTVSVGGASNSALGSGTLTLNGGALTSTNDGGANYDPTYTNAVNVTGGGGSISGGSGTALHFNGNITGSGALGLSAIYNASGLTLGGDNSGFDGTVTVTGADTRLDSTSAGSPNAAWVINGNLQTDVAGGGSFQFGSLSGSGVIDGHATNASTAVSTIVVGALNANTIFSGSIIDQAQGTAATGTIDGAANNQLALAVVGGTLALAGNNTYSGATTVSAGTLIVSGSVSASASSSVAAGATLEVDGLLSTTAAASVSGELSGVGSISGATLGASTSVLAPGDTVGSTAAGIFTSTGNITLDNNSVLSIRIGLTNAGTDADELLMSGGTFSTDGSALLQIADTTNVYNATPGTLYDIIVNGDNSTGLFSNAPASGDTITTANNDTFAVLYESDANGDGQGTGNDVVLDLVSVPEPGTWASLIAGFGMLLVSHRSRRRGARR